MSLADGVKEYLESSTIHGLVYISTTRSLVRLFWILAVFLGFSWAAVMINHSLQSWAESPVSTTIETRSIAEIRFPQVGHNVLTSVNFNTPTIV